MEKLLLFATLGWIIFACSSPSHDLLIANVNVIDVVTGEVLPNRTVAIDGDEITAIYTKVIKPKEGTEVVDGTGKYLIPGLWDMHVHNNWNYEDTNDLMLANGITGAREMWGNMAIRRKMVEDRAAGRPIIDIYSAGVIIDGSPRIWPGSDEVTDSEEAAKIVECQIAQGADFIKIYSRLDSAAFYSIAKTTKELGVPFAGHVPEKISVGNAASAGMLTMEHLYGLEKYAAHDSIMKHSDSLRQSGKYAAGMHYILQYLDTTLLDRSVAELVNTGTWFSPSTVTMRGWYFEYDSAFTADSRVEYLPQYLISNWFPAKQFGSKPDSFARAQRMALWQLDMAILRALVRNGASIIAGTDFPNSWSFPGFSMHDELEIYVQAGMTPLQALQTATINPSKVMNNDRIGAIEKGKLASLVLLNNNPLEDINAIRDIESVVLRGKVYDRIALDEMLDHTKEKAALPTIYHLIMALQSEGNMPGDLLALESKLDSLSEKYNLSGLEFLVNGIGYSYLGENDFENAIQVLELNTRLYPHSQNVWDSYAEVFLMQVDTSNALQYYQKALDIYPCNQEIEKRLLTLIP